MRRRTKPNFRDTTETLVRVSTTQPGQETRRHIKTAKKLISIFKIQRLRTPTSCSSKGDDNGKVGGG